ncbi:uncharacterized protein [Dasypus novemcinctus]|uniref:uncharacterized protein n=1 Tax=Dasypus novemcinctus TaxID=9361 RepID=UPI00265DB14D|nr:uncharacterized protein LOC111763144 [Dasypus novemcinctus]
MGGKGMEIGRPRRRRSFPEPLEQPGAGVCLVRGGGELDLAAWSGVPCGTASWVCWLPLPVRVGRWSGVGSAVQPGSPHRRSLPATAEPRAAAQLQAAAPPPARAAASSAPVAAPPAPAASSDSSRGGCQPGSLAWLLPFPSLLALSPPPPSIHSLLLFCKAPASLALQGARRHDSGEGDHYADESQKHVGVSNRPQTQSLQNKTMCGARRSREILLRLLHPQELDPGPFPICIVYR